MICKNCGKESPDNVNFCDECGYTFINNSIPQAEDYNAQHSISMYNTVPYTFSDFTAPKRGITLKKFLFITIPIFVGIIVISIVANILIIQKKEDDLRELYKNEYTNKMDTITSSLNDWLEENSSYIYISNSTELYSKPSWSYSTGETFKISMKRPICGYNVSIDEERIVLWIKVNTEDGYNWIPEHSKSLY